jgi:anti-anti-sigma factor
VSGSPHTFRIEPRGDREFVLDGELDMASTSLVADAMGAVGGARGDVVFDIAALTFIDSSGVLALTQAADTIEDGSLILRRPTDAVRRVFDLVGLTEAAPRISIEG